ncbi:hypothetical protein QCA50_010232 [Cerrena zonata]|uniref:Uncharacterized protein n=1 Tax=Cerrena zonata TaxID=2478898 RepID=A0AAW0G2M6_9APHY
MFRASPWVTYDPNLDATTSNSHSFPHIPAMASEDVEMDAPQISTLREDETPEPDPTPARTTKFRVKLLVGGGKAGSSSSKTQMSQPESEDDDEDDDDDDEEDQLIDDDDEEEPEVKVVTPSPAVSAAPSARGTPVKRGAAGRGRGGRKRGAKAGATVPPVEPASTTAPAASTSAPPAAATKKRGGATGTGRGRGGGRKRGNSSQRRMGNPFIQS